MENAIANTTQQHYITSIAALNIPSLDGTGDWHFSDCFIQHGDFLPQQHLAEIDTISTRHLLGDYGIYECSDILKKYGAAPLPDKAKIYAANHYRAVVDMIFDLIKNGQSITDTVILDDWFPEDSEKQTVYQLLDKLKADLTDQQWMMIDKWKQRTDEQI